MSNLNIITLKQQKNGLITALYSGPYAETIREVFGCVELPTAFTSAASRAHVLSEIASLNPDALVRFE